MKLSVGTLNGGPMTRHEIAEQLYRDALNQQLVRRRWLACVFVGSVLLLLASYGATRWYLS